MGEVAKKLKVKIGSCKRLGKDLEFYRKEERSQTEKIEKMKKEQADPYSIKKQEEVLAETLTMITDTRNRIEAAIQDLTDFMDEIKTMESGNSTIQSSSDWTDALAVIEHLHKLLTS